MSPWYQPPDYLSQSSLDNLREYQYKSIDLSPTTHYILRHWWNFVASLMPSWLAPNLITLLGFAFVVANVISIILYMPDLEGPAPRSLYFSFALGLFIYQTLDNVDGKQARKTGTSSPLGELFDHTIDSLNCALGALVEVAAMGLGHSGYGAALILVASWPMYFSAWEEYHTGVLYLGVINGPTEGLLIAMSAMLLSGFYGPDLWQSMASTVPFIGAFVPKSWKLEDLFLASVFGALVFGHAPFCLLNVYTATKKKGTSFVEAITQLTPMFFFTAVAGLWVASPYSSLLSYQRLIEFAILLSLTFGRISSKIILAHLVKGPFPWYSTLFIPLAGGCFLINLPFLGLPTIFTPATETLYLYTALSISFIGFTQGSLAIIEAFCTYLGINCLTIPSKVKLAAAGGSAKAAIE